MKHAQLEKFIFEKMSATRLPGLSIALVRNGRVVYARGFGLADIAKGVAATPETNYAAASITKSFVAVSIMQLVERKLLKVSDPVRKFVPCPIDQPGRPVRIAHLLSHTSGTPALAYIEAVLRHAYGLGGKHLPIGNGGDVIAFMRGADDWAECAPGKRWFYLNEGYILLGEIIREITGLSFDDYIRENIFKPLGMSRSCFCESDAAKAGHLATPYILQSPGQPRPGRYLFGSLNADAALITNALDLAKYVMMFLDAGGSVLTSRSVAEMTRPRVPFPAVPQPTLLGDKPDGWSRMHYGYGLSVGEFFGQPLICHGGSVIISTSWIGFLPESRAGVALLTNGSGYATAQFGKYALATLLGKDVESLPFVRMDRAMDGLAGMYQTYRGTLAAKVVRAGNFLRLEYQFGEQSPATMTMVPERVDGDRPRFFTYEDNSRQPIEFRRLRDGGVEFVYERYKFRRTGPVA
jgi:CubicO group peptidase (beta-lactamase class C family)